ncbi:MAG: M16 family metallopeptidase [Pyrinomonadaceae bacterium]
MSQGHTPPRRPVIKLLALAAALLSACLPHASAQTPQPQREQLLNGLKILFVPRAGDGKVWMKLRVHTGAAFDLANREGTTALLAELLFPDPSTPQYAREELGGQLDVRTTYDSIDVTLGGNASDFERLAELLRNAFLQMRLAPEDVLRLKSARIKALTDTAQTPAQLADRAVRARLFGAHPYARPVEGTPASLARVERADLMLARDRFLSPDNATLVVVGGVDPTRAMRTFRQLLGGWRKGDGLPPATFRQPDAPDPRTLVVPAPGATQAAVVVAVRGVARSDKDRAAATLLAPIVAQRWAASLNERGISAPFTVSHESYLLAGVFRMSATVPVSSATSLIEAARAILSSLASRPITQSELESARCTYLCVRNTSPLETYPFADAWLDSITYGYNATADEQAMRSATVADLQRVAARLFGEPKIAVAVAGDESQLRAALAGLPYGIEVAGAQNAPPTPAQQTPAPKPTPQPATRRP